MQPLKLSELTALIGQVINNAFGYHDYWIVAEISNHKSYGTRHYFDLVEKSEQTDIITAKVSAVAWDDVAPQIKYFENITEQKFTSGIKVLLKVRVNYSSQYGLSLYIQNIDPSYTLGELARKKKETLNRLVRENDFISFENGEYYTRNKSLLLPAVIQKIAIVSSVHSAGVEDFRRVLDENQYGYYFEMRHFHASVQGENKCQEIVDALINVFYAHEKENFDAVVILRGGGSETDFRIFDEYTVGLAVAKFPVPVFTGIGHSKDKTIADLMSHTSTKTPTDTAKYFIEYNHLFETNIIHLRDTVVRKTQTLQHKLNTCLLQTKSAIVKNAHTLLVQNSGYLEHLRILIRRNISLLLQRQFSNLEHIKSFLHLAHPNNLLKKGFAIVKHNNKIIVNADGIAAGDIIEVVLSGDKIISTVNDKTKYDG
ncbi:MAG: exodeoxyribonuclease VII large subunit [Bacteroidales bacterium]|jgi:exodeoxyribonuclease VII large subunit|nr:exodeoxyribonuclease VII large subunit [Bacteroidales bacterium]